MKWTPWFFGSLTVALLVGCGGDRRNTDTGATADTAAIQSDTTGATGGTSSDTAQANQTKSGVTDTIRPGGDTAGSSQ
jgi:hypothetical protein